MTILTPEQRSSGLEKAGLFLLLVLAVAVRVFFLLKYENMPGFAEENVRRALLILENPDLRSNFDGSSSTLYRYAIAGWMYFWRDPILAPKIMTLFFGTALIVPYYKTVKVILGRQNAFFSGFVLVFYTMHAIYSSVTISDAVYYFFLFCSFYYFFSFLKAEKGKSALWSSAVFLNIAAVLRPEGCFFVPVFCFLLWPRGKKKALLFGICSMFLPLTYLALSGIFQNDFFVPFTSPMTVCRLAIQHNSGEGYDLGLGCWLCVLWRTFDPGFLLAGSLGAIFAFLLRRGSELSLFLLISFLTLTVSTSSGWLVVNDRYSIILGLLLIPYAWFFAEKALWFLGNRKAYILAGLLVIPAFHFWKITQHPDLLPSILPNQICSIPQGVKEVGEWLRQRVGVGERIIIDADPDDLYPVNIFLRSGLPSKQHLALRMPRPWVKQEAFSDEDGFREHLLTHQPRYVILASNGYLRNVLRFDPGEKRWVAEGLFFENIFEREIENRDMKYSIYRVSYGRGEGDA
ncbi:MAG: glycosyltransferase family 39 protein [Candidatus Omnitrophica bacterium]|nr:glycosyltransferase family 39 protein [Candidatus Omnitrophota bacterium]